MINVIFVTDVLISEVQSNTHALDPSVVDGSSYSAYLNLALCSTSSKQ